MSTAPHEPHAVAAHDAEAHAFDGEPARALPLDEPPTPLWVPTLGLALFVVAGVAFLASSAVDAPAQPARTQGSAEAEARPAPKPAAQRPAAQKPAPAPPASVGIPQMIQRGAPGVAASGIAPAGVPSANIRKLTPEEVDAMKKRMRDARPKGGAQPLPQPLQAAPTPPK